MPESNWRRRLVTKSDSHGTGTGPVGFGGVACAAFSPPAVAAGEPGVAFTPGALGVPAGGVPPPGACRFLSGAPDCELATLSSGIFQSLVVSRWSLAGVPLSSGCLPCRTQPARKLRLVLVDQVPDSLRIALAVSVAQDRVAAAAGIDLNVGPQDSRADAHRSNIRDGDTLLIAAEQASFDARDALRPDRNLRGKNQVPGGPAAGDKQFRRGARFPGARRRFRVYTHSRAPFFHIQT